MHALKDSTHICIPLRGPNSVPLWLPTGETSRSKLISLRITTYVFLYTFVPSIWLDRPSLKFSPSQTIFTELYLLQCKIQATGGGDWGRSLDPGRPIHNPAMPRPSTAGAAWEAIFVDSQRETRQPGQTTLQTPSLRPKHSRNCVLAPRPRPTRSQLPRLSTSP